MKDKQNVVIGTLGVVKDAKGRGKKRWDVWRPTLGVVMQPDFPVHRLELFYPRGICGWRSTFSAM